MKRLWDPELSSLVSSFIKSLTDISYVPAGEWRDQSMQDFQDYGNKDPQHPTLEKVKGFKNMSTWKSFLM